MINFGLFFRPFKGFSGALELSWKDRYLAPSFWYEILNEPVVPFDDYIVDGDGHPNGLFNGFVAQHFARELIDHHFKG